jgi:hypothetical protein
MMNTVEAMHKIHRMKWLQAYSNTTLLQPNTMLPRVNIMEVRCGLSVFYTTLWMNNFFFVGAGIIGPVFVAIQYAAMAGWSVGVKRVGLAMVHGSDRRILTLVLWFATSGDVFHWTHSDPLSCRGRR